MNAPFDRLHADLADLAEQVTVVDLRERTLRTSRYLSIRRTLLGVATAVAVLAIGAGTAFAVLPGRHTAVPAGPGPSDQPPVTASLSPSPSVASPSDRPPTKPADPVPGLYLYRRSSSDGTITDDVWYRPGGGDWRKVATVKPPSVPKPAGPPPVVMSPDRQYIAWYLNGSLQVSALDGSQVKTLATDIDTSICGGPTWTGDSHHLLYQVPAAGGGEKIYAVNVDGTGRRMVGTYANGRPCILGSFDGNTVYAGFDKKVIAFKGGGPSTITARWPAGTVPSMVVAVSPTAARLLVSITSKSGSCGCSPPQRYVILDPATGQVTPLNNAKDKQGSAPMSGAFTAEGRVVLIADRNRGNGSGVVPFLTIFGTDGAIVGSVELPPMEYGYLVGLDR